MAQKLWDSFVGDAVSVRGFILINLGSTLASGGRATTEFGLMWLDIEFVSRGCYLKGRPPRITFGPIKTEMAKVYT